MTKYSRRKQGATKYSRRKQRGGASYVRERIVKSYPVEYTDEIDFHAYYVCPDGSTRGAGRSCVVNCKEGYTRNGDNCVRPCPDGYDDIGTECVQKCNPGYTALADGITCEESALKTASDTAKTAVNAAIQTYKSSPTKTTAEGQILLNAALTFQTAATAWSAAAGPDERTQATVDKIFSDNLVNGARKAASEPYVKRNVPQTIENVSVRHKPTGSCLSTERRVGINCITPKCNSILWSYNALTQKCEKKCDFGTRVVINNQPRCIEQSCPRDYIPLADGISCKYTIQFGGRKKTLRKKRNTGKKSLKAKRRM
jgi:hypothetical protein